MLDLDHLVVIAPSLAEGLAHARACLGLDLPEGGRHPEMGTRNHLLRLGDSVFLEVIAIDEDASVLHRARWFGLDERDKVRADWESGRRLRTFVARTRDLPGLLESHGGLLGTATRVSRGSRAWDFSVRSDGSLPADGAAPCAIDWGERGPPAAEMPDPGARLESWSVAHPDPEACARLYRSLGLRDPPAVGPGPAVRFEAVITTTAGVRVLT